MASQERRSSLFAAVWLLSVASGAFAQSADRPEPQPQAGQGPMRLERVHNAFVIAPDFKVADIDRSAGSLVGAYGGWLFDNHLLIGGAGYGLVQRRGSVNALGYGGVVVGWQASLGERLGFDVKALTGGGRASLSGVFDDFFPRLDRDDRSDARTPSRTPARQRFHQEFFVLEPQADLLLHLNDRIGISIGAGYRVTGEANGVDRRLRGASGSIALRFTGGSK